MSGIPNEIPEYGDVRLKPRQNPDFAPGAGFGTEEYFVWSRCDGTVSLHDIILMVGFGTSKSIGILAKLRQLGAVLLPGESSVPASVIKASQTAKAVTVPGRQARPSSPPSDLPPSSDRPVAAAERTALQRLQDEHELDDPTEEEAAALAMKLPMEMATRVRIIKFHRRLGESTLFELLEIEPDADKRAVKRSYFRLSKEFHPDRHYGKELGPFGPWLADVFKAVSDAFKVLGDNSKRATYESSLRGDEEQPQTRAEHARALFQNACDAELAGETSQALKLFAAAIRMDEQARYLRRAAMCAVTARSLSVAEEYAKKAAYLCDRDASYLRVLADVYRAGSRLKEARQILEEALKLDTESDVLFGEIQTDLATVNELMTEISAKEGN